MIWWIHLKRWMMARQCYLKLWARMISPPKKKLAKVGWLSITTSSPYWGDHPISHHLGGTVQALKRESKNRIGFGVFRVRLLTAMDLNRQEIIKGPTSTLLNFDQFLPRRSTWIFGNISIRFVVPKKRHLPQPTNQQRLWGLIPIRQTWGGCHQ